MGAKPVIHDVIGGNTARLEALVELFTDSFPEYAHTASRLRLKASLPANAHPCFIAHQWLAELDGQAAGLLSFKYAPARALGLALYLAVKPAYRHTYIEHDWRLSEWLFRAAMETLCREAQMMGRPTPSGLFMEVNPDRLVARYRQFGFIELAVEYYEPRFRRARQGIVAPTDGEEVDWARMHLGGFPIGDFEPTDPALLANVVMAFMVDHYGLPPEHWAVRQALDSIRQPALEERM